MNTSTLIAPPALVRRAEQKDTKAIQALDSAHYMHPFTDHGDLATRGARVMTHADNIYVWDSEGRKVLDGMSGLWCVNAGYGRKELADAAYQQMMSAEASGIGEKAEAMKALVAALRGVPDGSRDISRPVTSAPDAKPTK